MTLKIGTDRDLLYFSEIFDTAYEDKALNARGYFLKAYPISKLKKLKLDDYVIGKGTASFCAVVEAKTRAWALIQGATSAKFGIYFGKTKSDPEKIYRYTKKFGDSPDEAYQAIKSSLLDLIKSAQTRDFKKIDENLLSQMFKAKILSLYYPEAYLNICSGEHLKTIAEKIGLQRSKYLSQIQNALYESKLQNKITENWSNPKYMSYLYAKFIREGLGDNAKQTISKPAIKRKQKVNFEDINENRDKVGKLSEKFALEWEKDRLYGLGYQELAGKVKDCTDKPAHGYDFQSYSAPNQKRYIEVKSVGKDRKEGCFRFYLSENERDVSETEFYMDNYYFYLVFYNSKGEPERLKSILANDMYSKAELSPCVYCVRFSE